MYQVLLTRQSKKDLEKIRKGNRRIFLAIVEALNNLAEDPYPSGSVDMGGREGRRIKVGGYRILYSVLKDELIVEVFRVGPRGDIYKK